MLFSILTLVSALSISVIAAYFSIIGLATIFPGSIEAVIAMGAALEIGKIVAAIWLHKNWKTAPKMLRIYLFGAIVVLMGITSMGIFGFLSKSHIEHEQHAEKAAALVTQVETKIDREKQYIIRQKELIQQSEDKNQNRSDKSAENIDLEQKKIDQLTAQLEKDIALDSKMLAPIQERINQLNAELNEAKNKPGGLFSNKKKDVENKIAEQASEREELSAKKKAIEDRISKYRNETSALISDIRKRIQEYQNIGFDKPEDTEAKIEKYNSNILDAQERIDSLELEKFDLDDGSRQLEAEVGPIKYVAELITDFTGMNFDIGKAVRVIIILIFVFDPLAVLLVLAAHISLSKKFPKMMEDESVIFEKISEIEAENKALNQQQLEIEERKKDLEQDKKILELNENQVKKYQNEISEHKETLRQLKLETQKELLEKEDTSKISAELDKLLSEKQLAQLEIDKIKTEKKQILSKADKAISSAKEIKLVLEKRNRQDKEIEKLKSEICLSIEEFSKIKNQTGILSAENSELKESNQEIKQQNNQLNKSLSKLKELNKSLQESSIDNNKLVEAIKQNSKTIKIHKIGSQETLTINSTKHKGSHSFSKNQSFSESDIQNMVILSGIIDSKSQNIDQLEPIFNQQITQFLNPKLSNREYNLSKPVYKFSS
jgi:chromosome segregation ATPase